MKLALALSGRLTAGGFSLNAMRQVFLEFPWVHAPAPTSFLPYFQKHGRFGRLRAGQAIYNGGTDGEVAWILSGLCTYRMQDSQDREHFFTLVPQGRLMGNVDAYTGSVVNILDFALRPTEVLLMPRHRFIELLAENGSLAREHTEMLVREHESDLEGMFSAVTDRIEVRLARLLAALVFRDRPRLTFRWSDALADFETQPVPYGLTVTEMARTVGATRTAVSLTLTRWEKEGGLVRRNGVRCVTRSLLESAADWLTGGGPSPKVAKSRRRSGT